MDGTIDAALDELVSEFDMVGDPVLDWEGRYQHLIDLGRALPPLSDAERTDDRRVRGCAAQVWLVEEATPDGRLVFRGASDADIPQGLIAVLTRLLSGRRPQDILAFDARGAFARLGFAQSLTAQRANGLASMVERIRRTAAGAESEA